MKKTELSRREFSKLTLAAVGGIVAGTAVGCKKDADKSNVKKTPKTGKDGKSAGSGTSQDNSGGKESVATNDDYLFQEPHVCRGLNACKSQGVDKKNSCAGQGACATATGHSCHGENTCKGQGGCGETAGRNECKTKGECGVPLKEETWKKVRAKFETIAKTKKKTIGKAPAKKS